MTIMLGQKIALIFVIEVLFLVMITSWQRIRCNQVLTLLLQSLKTDNHTLTKFRQQHPPPYALPVKHITQTQG